MLVGCDALRRVDRERVAETKQQSAGLLVREAAPFNVGDLPLLRADPQAVLALSEHLDDITIVADLLVLAVDHAPCAPVQSHAVAGG